MPGWKQSRGASAPSGPWCRGLSGPAIELLRVQTNPIAIKTALNLLGHEVGGFRLPLVEATPGEEAAVRGCLERLGLLQSVSA